jgi:hypothetical protein
MESGSLFFFSTLWNSNTIISKAGNNWCLNRLCKKVTMLPGPGVSQFSHVPLANMFPKVLKEQTLHF